jgi:hypothetical protein
MADIAEGQMATIDATIWQVLTIENDKALLLRDRIVCRRPSGIYADMRRWLNEEYFPTLPAALREAAVPVYVSDETTTHPDADGDRVFLLSATEARKYFSCNATRAALDEQGGKWWWWLRSPDNRPFHDNHVGYHGGLYDNANIPRRDPEGGIRPALWVDLGSLDGMLDAERDNPASPPEAALAPDAARPVGSMTRAALRQWLIDGGFPSQLADRIADHPQTERGGEPFWDVTITWADNTTSQRRIRRAS